MREKRKGDKGKKNGELGVVIVVSSEKHVKGT
jgi:hypothetical protein